jgi:hypothetical protein
MNEDQLMQMFKGETLNVFSETFNCCLCSKKFKKAAELRLHCITDHRIKKFKCSQCNHSFNTKGKFMAHWRKKHHKLSREEEFHLRNFSIQNESIKCPICSRIFTSVSSLHEHNRLKHNASRSLFMCDKCAESFKDPRTLQHHIIRRHTEGGEDFKIRGKNTKPMTCNDCGVTVIGLHELQNHTWKDHLHIKIVNRNLHECLVCKENIKTRNKAKRHYMEVHEGGQKLMRTCGECGMDFQLYDDFEWHVKNMHVDSHICLICGLSSRTSIDLFNHTKTHRLIPEHEKKFICDCCGYRAEQKKAIVSHMIKLHGGAPIEYSSTCELCGKTFTSYPCFYQHMQAHFNQKKERMKCRYCERSYMNKHFLRNHEKTHTDPETYECMYPGCNKSYNNLLTYRQHICTAHQVDRKQCKTCLETFASYEKLVAHTDLVHPEVRPHRCYCGKSFGLEIMFMRHKESCLASTFGFS